jgi:hypothetical protein
MQDVEDAIRKDDPSPFGVSAAHEAIECGRIKNAGHADP